MAVPLKEENAMLRIPSPLAVGVLLLSIGSTGAGAESSSGWVVGEPQSTIDRVQYDDGGRCYNRCVSGRVFRRCQTDPRAETESCCNLACNRLNNRFFYDGWSD
jgi:hypothetical protein